MFTAASTSRSERLARNFIFGFVGGRVLQLRVQEVVQERLCSACLLWVVLQPDTMQLVVLRFLGPRIQQVLASLPNLEAQIDRPLPSASPWNALALFLLGPSRTEVQIAAFVQNLHCAQRRRHRAMRLPHQSHQVAARPLSNALGENGVTLVASTLR